MFIQGQEGFTDNFYSRLILVFAQLSVVSISFYFWLFQSGQSWGKSETAMKNAAVQIPR